MCDNDDRVTGRAARIKTWAAPDRRQTPLLRQGSDRLAVKFYADGRQENSSHEYTV